MAVRSALGLAGAVLLFLAVPAAAPAPAASVNVRAEQEVFRFQDPAIFESSGLVVQDGFFVTVNDSGSDAVLYAVDPLTGETIAVTRWADAQIDAEALAPAPGNDVWVGDIGDNRGERPSIEVARVPVTGVAGDAIGESYTLVYPREAADAEALLADPVSGRVYVVTKSLLGGRVYQAPEALESSEPNRLTAIGRVMGSVTDGAFFPDGRHIILRDYGRAAIYSFPSMELVGEFELPDQRQGEGLAVASDGSIYLSSEGRHTPVLRVDLPDYLRTAMRVAATASPEPVVSEAPEPGTPTQTEDAPADPGVPWWPFATVAIAAVAGVLTGLSMRRRNAKK